MTDVVQAFSLTLPAGSGGNTVYFTDCPLGWADVTQIDLSFPPGCAGLVGARVEYAENPVYPIGPTPWFILDDYVISLQVSRQKNAGQWRIAGYSQDNYPHIIRAYFYFNYVDAPQGQSALVSL